MPYSTMTLEIENHIAHVSLSRPEAYNTMILEFWQDMVDVLNNDPVTQGIMHEVEGRYVVDQRDRHSYMSWGPRYRKFGPGE